MNTNNFTNILSQKPYRPHTKSVHFQKSLAGMGVLVLPYTGLVCLCTAGHTSQQTSCILLSIDKTTGNPGCIHLFIHRLGMKRKFECIKLFLAVLVHKSHFMRFLLHVVKRMAIAMRNTWKHQKLISETCSRESLN